MASESTYPANRLVTVDELLTMGTDFHGELVRGKLIEMAPAGWDHGDIANTVAFLLTRHVRAGKLGKVFAAETGFTLERDPDTVRAPDVAFVRADRIPTSGSRRGFFEGPPDLAIEVVSPGDSASEVQAKADAWLAASTVEVWIIDPRTKTVTVYASEAEPRMLDVSAMLPGSAVLPGFSETVANFFE